MPSKRRANEFEHLGSWVSSGLVAVAVTLIGLSSAVACASDDTTERDAGAPDSGVTARRPPAATLTLETTIDDPAVAPWFKVYRPSDVAAAVDATGRTLPVVVWANGGCFRAAFVWEALLKRWAAAGFVVVALDASSDPEASASTTTEDQEALVDWAIAQANDAESPYGGKLDTDRIVAAGNSCGGVTSLQLAAKDDRVAAVFVLSGSSALAATSTEVMSAISVPVGYVVGNPKEDIAAPNALADYDILPAGVPGMVISRSSGDHLLISTNPDLQAEEARMSLDWLDLSLYGTEEAYDTLTSETVCTGCEPGVWTLMSKSLESLRR